ncbi:DUF952 domain-containing protein [Microvirga sp. W0021]|uniref:DUF952 domain-containing protein n=1 Tax=Hohaiivirga grylli TaxID=3133970 RepID=A0ABV0BGR4_9HYPH
MIYKICPQDLWQEAEKQGCFFGAPIDLQDGFIHFSTASQARETAAKHFSGETDLLLIAIDESRLSEQLRYEPARNGDLFPHLYEPLSLAAVVWVQPLPMGEDGVHIFPGGL